ncbi:hypothetical protein ATE48_17475 [Candidatus Viadribacter manganicus]|uniref:Knr4/Smi1-like domain-containing protein n=2 Tax=Candidatus Viadribacter manganicus TaxID=1759059 RepID=A0A1B1ALY1_9PROT|nr:hypothetical protein ATE48_17475 [Candidatus Viadribacter manganicus]
MAQLRHWRATRMIIRKPRGTMPMQEFEEAVAQVERASGGVLPAEYRHWLRTHKPGPTDHRQTPFDLSELLKTQRLVQDVIPPGTLAIGDDGYGNLVLLRFTDGAIEWWHHERESNDVSTDTIRPSFTAYLELIAKGEV